MRETDGTDGIVGRWRRLVRRWPERPTLCANASTVSVAELDAAATEVATGLAGRGIGRGQRVAVCLDHEVALVETVLGVLCAGAAFVPIDRRHPDERVARVAAAAGSALTVTDRAVRGLAGPVVQPAALRAEGRDRPPVRRPEPAPGDSAYVLFTSGSTGEPKGVVVPHRALDRYLHWAVDRYLRFGSAGAPLFSSIAFDLTVTTLLAPLVAGRPVHLVPVEDGIFGVVDLLADGVCFDFVKMTPSHLRMMLAALEDQPATGQVACLVLGGESLPSDLVRAWRAVSPQTVVVNEYGPTETTVGCCVAEIDTGEPVPDEIAIGTAIPAVALYVLDDRGSPTETNEPGELYIGGATVADGYLGRPGLTAQRFVADPYSDGGRLYRSGDVVRRRADGALHYLGRNDDQVKIRGHRVELAEIAALVLGHPEVADGVVRAWHRAPDDVRLVAHVVPRPGVGSAMLPATLRSYLADRLPDHLVPQHVVAVDALPHTINGKVNTARLPSPLGAG